MPIDLTDIASITPPFSSSSSIDGLAKSPAAIIGTLLVDTANKMTAPGDAESWSLYYNYMPDKKGTIQKKVCCIYDSAGVLDGILMTTGEVIEHHGIQIRLRCEDYQEGWLKMKEVCAYLQQRKNITVVVGSSRFRVIHSTRTTSILREPPDEQRRFLFNVNFTTTIKEL